MLWFLHRVQCQSPLRKGRPGTWLTSPSTTLSARHQDLATGTSGTSTTSRDIGNGIGATRPGGNGIGDATRPGGNGDGGDVAAFRDGAAFVDGSGRALAFVDGLGRPFAFAFAFVDGC